MRLLPRLRRQRRRALWNLLVQLNLCSELVRFQISTARMDNATPGRPAAPDICPGALQLPAAKPPGRDVRPIPPARNSRMEVFGHRISVLRPQTSALCRSLEPVAAGAYLPRCGLQLAMREGEPYAAEWKHQAWRPARNSRQAREYSPACLVLAPLLPPQTGEPACASAPGWQQIAARWHRRPQDQPIWPHRGRVPRYLERTFSCWTGLAGGACRRRSGRLRRRRWGKAGSDLVRKKPSRCSPLALW